MYKVLRPQCKIMSQILSRYVLLVKTREVLQGERGMHMEQEEWKKIYEQYYKPMFLYALSLTNNVQDAEDLLQETFVKAFLSYERTGSLKAWLVKVLKNEFISMMRKRKREILSGDNHPILNEKSGEEGIPEQLIQEEERRQLFLAIQKLPLKSKEILIESIFFHLDDEQIAKEHHITRGNVRKIRSRAKQKLLQIIKEES